MSTCTDWPIAWPCSLDGVDESLQNAARALAQNVLWGLSGRRIGVCSYVEGYYPQCAAGCGQPYKGSDGLWRNGGAASECCRLLLHHRPIVEVTGVTELGAALTPGVDFVWSDSYLKRLGACWPCIDNCELPPVVVEYTAGVGFPAGTDAAMGELACEILKAWNGDACRLPSRATSITRQGVTVSMANPSEFVTNGQLGLPVADLWLRMVNPVHLGRPSRVYSPDQPRMERVRST